jgi:Muconolactone delta-isomerase
MLPFMVTAELNIKDPLTLFALLPEHRRVVDGLIRSGRILSYTVAGDRSKIWMVLMATSQAEVYETLAQLPLIRYMVPDVEPALFFDGPAVRLPQLSLN